MNENHFNYFRLKNFKRFKDLEVKDIGQFNLVLGDNNVGKTSLMEGLLCLKGNGFEGHLHFLVKAFKLRNIYATNPSYLIDYFFNDPTEPLEFVDDANAARTKKQISVWGYNALSETGVSLNYEKIYDDIDRHQGTSFLLKNVYDAVNSNTQLPFVTTSTIFDSSVLRNFARHVQPSKSSEQKLVESLKVIVPEIEKLGITVDDFDNVTLHLYENHKDKGNNLTYYGDGTIRLVQIFLTIVKFKGHSVMIDEIDAGIHYSRMKDFWKAILRTANENDVQLFASTHNRECIESYENTLKELGEEYKLASRTITLKEHPKTQNVTAFTNRFDVLESVVELGNELR